MAEGNSISSRFRSSEERERMLRTDCEAIGGVVQGEVREKFYFSALSRVQS